MSIAGSQDVDLFASHAGGFQPSSIQDRRRMLGFGRQVAYAISCNGYGTSCQSHTSQLSARPFHRSIDYAAEDVHFLCRSMPLCTRGFMRWAARMGT